MTNQHKIFYVYVLFDHAGVPRYVGKGRGQRWLDHEKHPDPNNQLKNKFISETLALLGEVPKVKVHENLLENDAYNFESVLIRAVGRYPVGPLTNLTDNRNGPSSETIRAWHASRTFEERSASAKKSRATDRILRTSAEIKERHRANALACGVSVLSQRMVSVRSSQSPEKRKEIAAIGGRASSASLTQEQRREKGRKMNESYMRNTTKEQRKEDFKKHGLSKLTKEQLSENGKKGAAIANSKRTREERVALSLKAVAARLKKKKLKTFLNDIPRVFGSEGLF